MNQFLTSLGKYSFLLIRCTSLIFESDRLQLFSSTNFNLTSLFSSRVCLLFDWWLRRKREPHLPLSLFRLAQNLVRPEKNRRIFFLLRGCRKVWCCDFDSNVRGLNGNASESFLHNDLSKAVFKLGCKWEILASIFDVQLLWDHLSREGKVVVEVTPRYLDSIVTKQGHYRGQLRT